MNKSMMRNLFAAGLIIASLPASACGIDPFIGSVCTVGFNFCPRGFAQADGSLLSISQNTALFSLLGTQFGGDGTTNFALPDLRSRSVVGGGMGQGPGLSPIEIGEKSGAESVSLTIVSEPLSNQISKRSVTLNAVTQVGGSPFNIRSPYLGMVTCIAMEGIYPSRP